LHENRHAVEALGMPRRQDHYRLRMRHQHILEGFEHERFLTLDGAAADQHRACVGSCQRLPQALDDRGRWRQTHVKLQAACDLHAVR